MKGILKKFGITVQACNNKICIITSPTFLTREEFLEWVEATLDFMDAPSDNPSKKLEK